MCAQDSHYTESRTNAGESHEQLGALKEANKKLEGEVVALKKDLESQRHQLQTLQQNASTKSDEGSRLLKELEDVKRRARTFKVCCLQSYGDGRRLLSSSSMSIGDTRRPNAPRNNE